MPTRSSSQRKARDEANAVLSHELRTPLAAISSMIDVLELGHDERRHARQERIAAAVR